MLVVFLRSITMQYGRLTQALVRCYNKYVVLLNEKY